MKKKKMMTQIDNSFINKSIQRNAGLPHIDEKQNSDGSSSEKDQFNKSLREELFVEEEHSVASLDYDNPFNVSGAANDFQIKKPNLSVAQRESKKMAVINVSSFSPNISDQNSKSND